MKWSIKAMGERDGRIQEREFIVFADTIQEATEKFWGAGIKVLSDLKVEPAVEVATNLQENRKAPGA